jgi:hypothetical protein
VIRCGSTWAGNAVDLGDDTLTESCIAFEYSSYWTLRRWASGRTIVPAYGLPTCRLNLLVSTLLEIVLVGALSPAGGYLVGSVVPQLLGY